MKPDIEKLRADKTISELLEFGIIVVDKPAGMTSFDVSDKVRRMLKLRKTSHFGTLDPMVTGVLPVALNRAVKLTGFFLGEDKEYEGIMRIHEDIAVEKIKEAIERKFTGKIMQLPPVKSRVKRQEREREIKSFELLEKNGKDIAFKTEVQGGTYIRKLIHDLGQELGIGAHMLKLRRIRAGIFDDKELVQLKDLENMNEEKLKSAVISASIVSEIYPAVEIKEIDLKHILTGKPVHKKDLIEDARHEKGEIVSVFCKDRFIGMYKTANQGDIFAMPEFVMQPIRS
jgi:H/ACA ribonucleoprotein complex subunit 4